MKNTISEKITLLRPVLIFLIVTTHIPGSFYRPDLLDIQLTTENFLHALLSGVIATSALPLLSVISGYLAAITYKKYKYSKIIKNKTFRILLPMFLWNLVLAIYIYKSQAEGLPRRPDLILYPFNIENWFLGLFSLFLLPANQPLYFLKELFLCFTLLPVFNKISKSKIISALFILLVIFMSVKGINLNLFLHRVDIYGFFFIGFFIYKKEIDAGKIKQKENILIKIFPLVYLAIALITTYYSFKEENSNFIYYIKILSIFGPLAFWMLSNHITGFFKKTLMWISPASFSVFLGHILVLSIFLDQWTEHFKSTPQSENYWLYWTLSFLICFTIMGSIAFIYRKILFFIKNYYQKWKNNL